MPPAYNTHKHCSNPHETYSILLNVNLPVPIRPLKAMPFESRPPKQIWIASAFSPAGFRCGWHPVKEFFQLLKNSLFARSHFIQVPRRYRRSLAFWSRGVPSFQRSSERLAKRGGTSYDIEDRWEAGDMVRSPCYNLTRGHGLLLGAPSHAQWKL